MHGAAGVIDVASGEVRALASYPDYDLNRLDDDYAKLSGDWMDMPLMNRATQEAREPGSTAKPMVGLGAITSGLMGVEERVACDGFLVLDGKKYTVGKCWTAPLHSTHMQIPYSDPHPTGRLSFTDALERSCNVYFETVGDRLKIEGLTEWFHRFGLGRPTGIGIDEVPGRVPGEYAHIPAEQRRSITWFSSIGQSRVLATPIQMANVAATIARDGIWMRPHLLVEGTELPRKKASTQPVEDRVDLHLNPAAVAAAKQGMYEVVNALAGTGRSVAHMDGNDRVTDPAVAYLHIAGKTGTAQAGRIRVPVRDAEGREVLDEKGKVAMEFMEPSIMNRPNPKADWYRADWEGKHFDHAWFIGFAPAEHPTLAFAVMVEYGGSGGATAGRVAKHVIEACVQHGYLPAASTSNGKEVASRD
jgi:penicillin-binding protein 2